MKWEDDDFAIVRPRTFKGKKGWVACVLAMAIGHLVAAAVLWAADLRAAAVTVVIIVVVGCPIVLREIWN